MEKLNFTPIVQYKKPMKSLLFGPQHAGKTWNSLDLAAGIVMEERGYKDIKKVWKHIAVLDTENRRAILVLRKKGAMDVNYQEIKPPFNSNKVVELQQQLDLLDNIDVIIHDSLTHYWAKKGGVLDEKAQKDKQGGNSYTNWQEYSAKFNDMIDTLLQSPKHIIITARSKNDVVMEENHKGKMAPVTYGLKPMLRDDIEYDFDMVFNVDKDTHSLIVDKGVPDIMPIYSNVTVDTGRELYQLFNAGTVIQSRTMDHIKESIKSLTRANNMVTFVMQKLQGKKLDELDIDELITIEKILIDEVKKQQLK